VFLKLAQRLTLNAEGFWAMFLFDKCTIKCSYLLILSVLLHIFKINIKLLFKLGCRPKGDMCL